LTVARAAELARVLTLRKQIMSESPHALFLLAGDTISPSVESITYQGRQMIDAWNSSGLDYATLGITNSTLARMFARAHERFAFQMAGSERRRQKDRQTFGSTPEFVVREFDGVKIGLFGIVLQETLQTSRPGPDVDILDPCATAAKVIPNIHAAGAQVVVALTHQTLADDKQLARCSGVDVIIGGHEHTLLESMSGHSADFQDDFRCPRTRRIDLNISKSTGKLDSIDWQVIPVTDQVKDDVAFAPINQKYSALLKTLEQPVGRTVV